jgi:hypothetical protein
MLEKLRGRRSFFWIPFENLKDKVRQLLCLYLIDVVLIHQELIETPVIKLLHPLELSLRGKVLSTSAATENVLGVWLPHQLDAVS